MIVICPPEYFRHNSLIIGDFVRFSRVAGVVLALLFAYTSAAQELALRFDAIAGPSFFAEKITATFRVAHESELDLRMAEVNVVGNRWRDVRIRCPAITQDRDNLICAQGMVEAPAVIPVSFRYSTLTGNLDLELKPAADERWRLTIVAGTSPAARETTLVVEKMPHTRLAPWWPATWPKLNAGLVSGKILLTARESNHVKADLNVTNLGFADASGLHAGEHVAATLSIEGQRRGEQWQWQSRLEWKAGDVLWQPVFVSGAGHVLDATGLLDNKQLVVMRGNLSLVGVGNLEFGATLNRTTSVLETATLKMFDIGLSEIYEKFLKPVLQGTALGDMRADGRMDIAFELRNGLVSSADLAFRGVSVEDKSRRFAVFGLNGRLPWHHEQLTAAVLKVSGGEILRVPFGAFDLPFEMRGVRLRVKNIEIPVLDGKLNVNDFATSGEGPDWRWRFSGAIVPIAMDKLTVALGLPVMHGTLSATIPAVSYQQSTLSIDGGLVFKVFDGTITARNVVLEQPLGKVPRLIADVDMRNLDLDLLTRTFAFGKITGRVDAHIANLELVNWIAARFDARLASSAGDFPRRISQAAVQSISSLGGAGAAAAIQRSFLRFFETFGYSSLGLSCRLESGVCHMGGIENVPQGYVIVKGGGIPAISVLGYNRSVGWNELIERLKRVTGGNVIVE